jgi:hypothetical protein
MWLARNSEGGLVLYRNEPKKKKIVINPDFPKYRKEIIDWVDPIGPYYTLGIPNDAYTWVTFENSPVKVKLAPVGYVKQ